MGDACARVYFSIEYLKGTDNVVADTLSLIPWFLVNPLGAIISTPLEEYKFSSSDSEEDALHLISIDHEFSEISASGLETAKVLSLNEIKLTQNLDSTLLTVSDWVKKGSRPALEELSGFPDTLRNYSEKFDSLEIREEILGVVDREDPTYFAFADPSSLVDELLREFHEGIGTAHERVKESTL